MGKEKNVFYYFLNFYSFRYSCFFTPKPNSRCLSFEDDLNNFKGPDGVLLCYKDSAFKEISRSNSDLPNDGRFGRQVKIIFYFIYYLIYLF